MAASNRLRHLLVESFFTAPLHHFWSWFMSTTMAGLASILLLVWGNGSLLLGLGIGLGCLFLVLLIPGLYRFRAAWKREQHLSLRRWWELRRYTIDGLDWQLADPVVKDGKAEVTIRISPTGELPQPIEVEVSCFAAIEGVLGATVSPPEENSNAQVEVPWHEPGSRQVYVILRFPKLCPPRRLDVRLRSMGNADIAVREVRRNPRRLRS